MTINKPLAERLRPNSLADFIGQSELLGSDKSLRRIIENKVPISLIFWGTPGTGKTTLARIVAKEYGYEFESFNASIDNKNKLTKIIEKYPDQTFVLLIDEIHRMTKTLQDFLLPYLEDGHIILIGATTENPVMSLVPAERSRCQMFEVKRLAEADVVTI